MIGGCIRPAPEPNPPGKKRILYQRRQKLPVVHHYSNNKSGFTKAERGSP